ncbi:hypothetical protein [Pseudaquidulcibacter saccharophilus]|uniref:hypothetical protein n=1 Tax=Pseudaquidulcibacter saccharophilus TaxID=2831900 RepID=UPI001EFF39D8|nr:hypothetical protein [Pseudaquidulcibacter saccharophilus]
MQIYKNLSGNAGVHSYDYGDDFIKVKFNRTDAVYVYTYESAGQEKIEKMKELADAGKGLTGYISQHIKNKYAYKE